MTSTLQLNPSTKFHLNIDELIREVHYRPAIWDKNCVGYSDRRLKSRMWDEVCDNIIVNWKGLKTAQQNTISIEIQKKWRNVKDAFMKEMKKISTGQDIAKRQYCHFKALSFLSNSEVYTSKSPRSINESDGESDNTSVDQDTNASSSRKRTRNKNEEQDESLILIKREKIQYDEENSNSKRSKRKTSGHEDNMLHIEVEPDYESADISLKNSNTNDYTNRHFVEIKDDDWVNDVSSQGFKTDEDKGRNDVKVYDEDISFTEMMIPMLKRLNEDQKHFAKIEILNILHKAKRYLPSSSCETQTEHDIPVSFEIDDCQ